MLVCGINKHCQLDKTSTNRNFNGDQIIDRPCEFHVDRSSISSFSTNDGHTVWITHDGKSYVTGYNSDGRISGSLPKETLTEDTEFILKDEGGQPCKFVSVVCGFNYTLYLVSSESGVTNSKLVFCYSRQRKNPLFVNIGKRTPRALFGGYKTSGVIDTEGGIIVLTRLVFEFLRKQVEATFLPGGDKPVKLACCDSFVIALGMSGRVYESEISSTKLNEFEIVKELSETTVVDVSGTLDFCFAVLNDGRVFGRGNNSCCQLGLPKETKSVSTFTLIESLKKHKIVSVFTGSYHSIFKTTENKMIVCGYNNCGQLFIPLKDKEIVYPPEEVPECREFIFCVTGNSVSAAFFDMKVSVTKLSELKKKVEDLKKKLLSKEERNSKLKEENSNLQKENSNLKKANSNLETQNIEYENNFKKIEGEKSEMNKTIRSMKSENKTDIRENEQKHQFKILGANEIKNYNKIKRIGRSTTSEVYEVIEERKLAMKIFKNETEEFDSDDEENKIEIDNEEAKKFLQESEVLNELEDEHIIKTYGFFFGDEEEGPAIILEYCESNLKKRIKKLTNEERIQIIVDIISTMKKVHSKGIIHRNLKLENILLDTNNRVKLSDFKHCTFIKDKDETINQSPMGSDWIYKSPEILQETTESDEKVDIYAFGVILYAILTKGQYPNIKFFEVIKGRQVPIPNNITEFSSQLIRDCMSFDPNDRPSFTELNDRLKGNENQLI